MPQVRDILPKSSELEEKGYVQGRINLYNVESEEKLEGNPSEFFSRTYPTGKIENILQDIRDNFSGHNPSGNYVIDGTYGSGKSHLMVTLYHVFANPGYADEWLNKHNIELDPPEEANVVTYSLQDEHPNPFWEPFFEALDATSLVDNVDSYPDKSTIEAALPTEASVLVLFDEIEDFYEGITDEATKASIRGFVQALTEAAAEPENDLYTASSLLRLGEGSRIVSIINRDDAGGDTLTDAPDKTEIIRHRLFDVDSYKESQAEEIVEQYTDKYQQVEHITLDSIREYTEKMEKMYPFHPNLMEVLEERFYNSAEYQSTRGMLYLLSCVVVNRDADVDLFTASDVDLMDENTLRQLNRVDRDVVENAKSDIPRINHIEYGPEIINTLTLHSLNVGPHQGGNDEELLLGVLRPSDRAQAVLDARGKLRGIARHLHKLNGEWAMKEDESIEVIVDNQLDEVDDSDALSQLASYVKNDVFEGQTYVLKEEDGNYSLFEGKMEENSPEIKILATLSGLTSDERQEVLKGRSNPNTILLVEPTAGTSINLRTHTQLLTKVRRVIAYEELKEEFDEDGKRRAEKLRNEEEEEIIERLRGFYGNWIKFSGQNTIPKGIDADEVDTNSTYYDEIVEKAEADVMDLQATISQAIEDDKTGVQIGQLLEDFRIQRGYPVLVDESKFDQAVKALIREDEAALQESGGVWKHDPPYSISRSARLYEAKFAPEEIEPLSIGISSDVTTCTPGTTGHFTITTTSEDYSAGDLDIEWSVNELPASEAGGSFTHTFEDEGNYTIKVTARHEETNQTDTANHTVSVQEEVQLGVNLSAHPPSPVQVGDEVKFEAVVSGADGHDIQYEWQVDSDPLDASNHRTIEYSFEDEGVYHISITAKTNAEEVSDTVRIQVDDAGPLLSTIEKTAESGSNLANELEGSLSGREIRKLEIDVEGEVSNRDALLAIRRLPDVENGEIKVKLRVEEEE